MTDKKKIFVFVDWYKPGYKAGGPIQSVYNLVTRLKDDYDFYVFTSNKDLGETESYENIQSDVWTDFEGIRVFYASKKNQTFFKIKSQIKQIKPDAVYVNSLFSFYYAIIPMLLHKYGIIKKLILAPRGMFAEGALSVKPLKKKAFFNVFKRLKLFSNITFHATSKQEILDIQNKLVTKATILLSPNLPEVVNDLELVSYKKSGTINLISLARISPEKGVKHLLQALKSFPHNLTLDLYGIINDANYWKECEEVIKVLPKNIEVTFKGSVESNKVGELYQKYDYFVLTTLGENFGHAIFQAFSAGLPVIISNKTPWRNLQEKNIGWDVDLKEDVINKALLQAYQLDSEEHLKIKKSALNFAKNYSSSQDLLNSAKRLLN